jgi:hypothetical protein
MLAIAKQIVSCQIWLCYNASTPASTAITARPPRSGSVAPGRQRQAVVHAPFQQRLAENAERQRRQGEAEALHRAESD